MKNLLTILSITLASATVVAETTTTVEFGAILEPIQAESSELPTLALSKYEQEDSNLWEILDADKNGFISKQEATASQQLSDQWDKLDSNKDEKLDMAEFSLLFSQKN